MTEPPLSVWLERFSLLKILDLSGKKLGGAISSDIANLRNLVTLLLSDMNLEGTIPNDLGKLGKIKKLELARNRLSGVESAWITKRLSNRLSLILRAFLSALQDSFRWYWLD